MKKFINFIILLLGLISVGASLSAIAGFERGLQIAASQADGVPLTIFRPATSGPNPVIVIAHGFAGSQQLMRPLAVSLAQNGFIAITFDFAGHGRNSSPMAGGVRDLAKSTNHLLTEIETILRFARGLDQANGAIGLVGHSMAAELVVQYAMRDKRVAATVALSLIGRDVTAASPNNLLVIAGAWEPAIIRDAGFRIAGLVANGPARERVTYGDFATGGARRVALAAGAEHIGVVYSRDAQRETIAWMNAAFDVSRSGPIDRRGKWVGLLLLGLVLLARPAASLLPRVAQSPRSAVVAGWRDYWPVAAAPAILTPLILWKLPTDFLPILLGDYLAVHFALYGVLTALVLAVAQRRSDRLRGGAPIPLNSRLVGAALAVAAFQILAIGALVDAHVTSFLPTGVRWLLIIAMFVSTAIYFAADAALIRYCANATAVFAVTKICFTLSLALAVALNPRKLFFLAIIVPVIFIFFIVYGLFDKWVRQATGEPLVPALGNALALAWSIAVTFPIVD